PVANWDLVALGPGAYHTALWASAIPMFLIAILFLGVKRWRGFLVGLAAGWAANLLVSAIKMPTNVAFMPGDAGLIDRIWLFGNAAVLAVLAALLMIRAARK